jgi:hypothetical protein
MLGKNIVRKFVTLTTLAAVYCTYSMVALAAPFDTKGEITVTGQVTVNGAAAVSGATVFSDSTITTAQGSSAVVSLGKLGRVEVQEGTSLNLKFSDTGIIAMLDSGRVRLSTPAGVASTVTTKNATFVGDVSQADNYLVQAECSHSHIDTSAGVVTMKEGSSDKQVAAGSTAVAGDLTQTGCAPCMRAGSNPAPVFGGPLWLLGIAAVGVGLGIWAATKDDDNGGGGSGVVVSPSR